MVKFSQEKRKIEEEINELHRKLHNINAVRKWVKLVHRRQLLTIAKDKERANRKMKANYSQNNEFCEQMQVLRKIAEERFNHALQHKMNRNTLQVNGRYVPSPLKIVAVI